MEKLTLKEIAGYSHTDLKFTCPERYNFGGMITDLKEVNLKCVYEGWIMFKEVPGFYPIEHFKPILYNLEMLTKLINHNGFEIIPIVEMIKELSLLDLSGLDFKFGHDHSDNTFWVNAESNGTVMGNGRVIDCLFYDGNVFRMMDNDGAMNILSHQQEGFELLNKYHFDWKYNLIERGLAIDKSKI